MATSKGRSSTNTDPSFFALSVRRTPPNSPPNSAESMYQPERDPLDRYLIWSDAAAIAQAVTGRPIAKTTFYSYLALLEEPRTGEYSNYAVAQVARFAQLMAHRASNEKTAQVVNRFARELATYASDGYQLFIEDVIDETRANPKVGYSSKSEARWTTVNV